MCCDWGESDGVDFLRRRVLVGCLLEDRREDGSDEYNLAVASADLVNLGGGNGPLAKEGVLECRMLP